MTGKLTQKMQQLQNSHFVSKYVSTLLFLRRLVIGIAMVLGALGTLSAVVRFKQFTQCTRQKHFAKMEDMGMDILTRNLLPPSLFLSACL